jgi:hypothetical protein
MNTTQHTHNIYTQKAEPVTIRLSYEWTFEPENCLPDGFESWTREEIVDWFKDDLAENLSEYVLKKNIRQDLQEVTQDNKAPLCATPDLLSALEEMMAVFQDHEQYDEESAEVIQSARAAIAKAKGVAK